MTQSGTGPESTQPESTQPGAAQPESTAPVASPGRSTADESVPALELDKVVMRFGGVVALREVTLRVAQGQIAA
ncbi:MAG: hypothetical protein QOE32_2296, partial [Pseudonocardiales bacterium]|nr:hypothetical protein [Pseudonocardiales bacterium]